MKSFLSVDFDYFVNVPDSIGCDFPNPAMYGFNPDSEDIRSDWERTYRLHPEFADWGVSKMSKGFGTIKSFFEEYTGNVVVRKEHTDMYNVVMDNTQPDEKFNVFNVDFHHDLYSTPVRLNCSNWATHVFDKRPQMEYYWVHRGFSDKSTLGMPNVFKHNQVHSLSIGTALYYFYMGELPHTIFLCFSELWTPPHLYPKFEVLSKALTSPLTRLVEVVTPMTSVDVKL